MQNQNELTQASSMPSGVENVSNDEITERIVQLKLDAGAAVLEIGRWLNVMKSRLAHGEWLDWLSEKIDFSERIAQQYMRLYDGFSANPNALSDLGKTRALKLLSLPPAEREAFVETHDVANMSTRELEQAIRERDEARHNEEMAKKTITAVTELAKKDREEAKKALEAAEQRAEEAEERAKSAEKRANGALESYRAAQKNEEFTIQRNIELQARVKELEARPVDVAVQVDEEAVKRAAEDAKQAADTEWSARVKELEDKLSKAEEKAKKAAAKAKTAGEDAVKQTASELNAAKKAETEARTEAERLRAELAAVKKEQAQAAVSGDADLAAFKLLFEQTQADVNKLHGLLLKVRSREDTELAGKLTKALLALADAVRGCAE